jgi:hypothetical protein
MPFDRRAAIEHRLSKYGAMEKRLAAEPYAETNAELRRLQRVIADLEQQLRELDDQSK